MTPMNNRRVVITGCGAVTPIGIGKEEFWSALERGENGVDYITLFDTEKHTTKIAAEVKNFNPENWLDKKEVRRTDRVLHFAAAGADLAVQDAGLDLEKLDKEMFGVYVGSGEGGIHTIEENFRLLYEKGPSRVSPFMVPMMITNMPAGYIAIRLGAKGPNMAVVTACASSTHSMGEAYNCIMRGDADVMITGGVEAAISPIYAEVKGYGLSCDAHHITAPAPDGDGAYRAMAMAVRKAGWKPEEIDLINAHGTSTPLNEKMETAAIKRLMGDAADKVMVQATKSMVGHALGAAGAVGTIAALLAFERGIVHPTINFQTPDPECAINVVPNKAVNAKVERALVNSFGFGGHNGVIAIESCK